MPVLDDEFFQLFSFLGKANGSNTATEYMKPTTISPKASNWVDRGESAIPTLSRVIGFFFNRPVHEHREWLEPHANTVLGMVAADATEIHIAGYLKSIAIEVGVEFDGLRARGAAISLWHIGKAALVRDFAERVLQGVPVNAETNEPLATWLTRLLTAEDDDVSS